MKTIVTYLIIFSTGMIHGQNHPASMKFKQTFFDTTGKVSETRIRSVERGRSLNLDFYRQNFYRPYHFPERFIDKSYRNQEVILWNDTTAPKDFQSNWHYSYTYDSLSRVTRYTYSGCLICSQLPYRIKIEYDNYNRPKSFQVWQVLFAQSQPDEAYYFRYDDNGDLIQLKYFRDRKIVEQIEKM